jgi:hypothetical protein
MKFISSFWPHRLPNTNSTVDLWAIGGLGIVVRIKFFSLHESIEGEKLNVIVFGQFE